MALIAIGGLIRIGTSFVAKVVAKWIGPECWVDDFDVFLRDELWVIFVLGVETFFYGVIHSINGGFAFFVASEGVKIGFLDEEENDKKRRKNSGDNDFKNGKTFFCIHGIIIAYFMFKTSIAKRLWLG